jgi:regulation of enolase protein 1 (concanavalin A-like superfamily)
VEEGRPALFDPQVANFLPQKYGWQRNGGDIAGATNRSYSIPITALTDNGVLFRAFITNQLGTTNTVEVQLTVLRDTNAPTVIGARRANSTNLFVIFSEPVASASALLAQNYRLTNATVLGAEFGPDTRTVILRTSPLPTTSALGTVIAVSNIFDRASTPNMLAGTEFLFGANEYNSAAIGDFTGLIVLSTGGTGPGISARGTDIGGRVDSFAFAWQSVVGDFDFRTRVESLDFADIWTKAGLMARETLSNDSRFAAALVSPTLAGAFFEQRTNTGSIASSGGSYPASFPSAWLRLQRAGNLFSGFASQDGDNWLPLGSISMALSNRIYFGFAVTSHNTNQTTTAQFRDLAPVSGGTIGLVPPRTEPLGPSSRRTGLVISEIMYHPRDTFLGTNKAELEFVEIFNSNPFFEDISGYRISGDIDYKFPAGTILPGGSFIVVARQPADVQAVYGISNVFGPFTNNLPNDNGRIRLRNQNDFILLEVDYSAKYPWPVAADGAGHSLVLARPSYGENQREAWAASDSVGGSPGRMEPISIEPLRPVVINEFLAHTDLPALDFIELYNRSGQPIDLGGAWLTDNPVTNKYRLPSPTIIPARGFLSFNQNQLSFSLDASGERIVLVNSNQTRVIDALGFESQANGISSGRFPDGAPGFRELSSATAGAANALPLSRDVVINEIMYHPISENSDDEFVELFNKGTNAVNLGGWRFTDGISFNFPSNTIIAAGSYLVVAKNKTNLFAHYGNLNAGNTVGDFDGNLRSSGERLALAMPQLAIDADDPLNITTNTIHIVVNEVNYRRGGQWGKWADGGGSSLELIDPRADNRLAPNWADSDETAKAPWTTIETTGLLDNGGDTPDSLHVILLEEGECLLDEVEVIPTGGGNRIANFNFESGLSGWTIRGNHERSSLENTGFNSSRSLHVRATSRGDTGPNKIHVPLTSALANGNTATIRARVRWLRGWPEILLRLRGSYLEATDRMIVPLDLGTPGARNSRYITNAGPAITEVTHLPAVPAANQPVVVTARVADSDGLASLVVKYRIDPATNFTGVPMTNASEGIFAATIPGQAADKVVAFIIEATDAALTPASSRFPAARDDNGPARECLVHFGGPVPASSFGTYRFWITGQSITNWSQREVLSNERILGTFVYGNQRVIYNAGARYSGSSAHQDMGGPDYSPVGTPNHYAFDMPGDDLLLGTDNFNKIHGAGNNHHDDNTLQRELVAYSVVESLGLPINHKRSVAMFINGARRGSLMEDTQVPNGDSVDSDFPDDPDGDLFKVSIWNEFGLTGQALATTGISEAYLNNYTTTGGAKKRARYRWNFQQRSINGTANDFTNLYTLVDAVTASASPAYTRTLNGLADMETWMRTFAVEHAVGNWDSFGYRNHQNMFAYKPGHGPWSLLIWDINIVFGGGTRGAPIGTNGDLLEIDTADTGMNAIYNTPEYRRAYWRALKDICDGPFLNAKADPPMDARFAAYSASGVNVDAPDYIKVWINQRRTYILSELAKIDTTNFTTSSGNFTADTNLVAISGVAPIGVRTIQVNGIAWPVTWTTLTNWTLRLPLAAPTNQLTVIGLDGRGQPVAGASNQLAISYTGPSPSPRDLVVINEIMYNPLTPDTSYVELFNLSTNFTFDLSGWRLNGLDFTFPAGTFITNRQFVLLVGNRAAFAARYGLTNFVGGEFGGNLQNDGETLTLIKPSASSNAVDLVVDKVRYENILPWSTNANGTGSSLQLIDPNQENSRVANWFSSFTPAVICCGVSTPARTNDGWRFASASGSIGGGAGGQFRLILFLGAELGTALIDDVWLVDGTNAAVGYNYVRNGDFELPLYEDPLLTNSWMVGTNYTNSLLVGSPVHGGAGALKLVPTTFGNSVTITATTTNNRVIYQAISPAPAANANATLSFWFWATNSSTNLSVRIVNSSPLSITTNINVTFTSSNFVAPTILTGAVLYASPGGQNQNPTNLPPFFGTNLPPFPPLWINEVQAENVTGITDNQGEHDPWIEIYNTSTNAVALDGLYLSSSYTNLANWAFPAGSSVGPTQFLVVFCDAQPAQTSASEYHTSFRLSATSGSIALSRIYGGGQAVLNGSQVLDYVNYAGLHSDRSYGSYPDGQPFDRQEFFYVTPRRTNDGRSAPLVVFINEWMASNVSGEPDPADGAFDDWFEIYNPGTNTVDLAGYYLTDSLANAAGVVTNKLKYLIATNGPHTIAPHGYLLVWADNETGQNTSANGPRPDLHVNFQLSKTGEAIGLFAADGTAIDYVTFGLQADDVSAGRIPDGGANIVSMPGAASPRAANHLSGPVNTPPVLNPIGNRTVNLGQTLTFTATATDSDLPAQILTYDLIGAPAGATIGAGTGNFSWMPNLAGSYTFTVRVSDNGVPARSAQETITVQVTGLAFGGPVRRGSNLELTWGTQSGKKYAVDAATNLTAPINWIPQVTNTAVGATLNYTNATTNGPQRFFKVRTVE